MAKKDKKMTLRQRLRTEAEKQLAQIEDESLKALAEVAVKHNIPATELAKVISGGAHKTLRHDLVTHLTNRKELELEKLYNKQMELIDAD